MGDGGCSTRTGGSAVVVSFALALTMTGCLRSKTVECKDGIVCPENRVCALDQCVLPEQLAQCSDQADGTPCTIAGTDTAACRSGVCLPVGCGNGFVDPGEVCDDGNNLAGDGCSAHCDSNESCGNAIVDAVTREGCDCGGPDTNPRPPGCTGPNSDAADSACLSNCTIRGCGDKQVSGLEDCEVGMLGSATCQTVGFYGGTLGCLDSCRFDTSGCVGRCGDGTLDTQELCDGSQLAGKTCQDFGFYQAAGLKCNALCRFDTSACTQRCGDGTVNGQEACEPGVALTQDCTDLGFYNPSGLACSPACGLDASGCVGRCGDGTVQSPQEACEAGMLGGKSCLDFGFYNASGLACTGCSYDTSACTGRCGDGTANIGNGESCDKTDLNSKTCLDFGFYASAGLACSAACGFDVNGCTGGRCGDGVVQAGAGELCDGTVPAGVDCTDFGFYDAKPVTCTGSCGYDLSQCTGYCGDGSRNGPEDCDGSVPGGSTCLTQGYYGGTLSCGTGCRFNTSQCVGTCGDGTVQSPQEACETGVLGGKTCQSFNFYGGTLACSGCQYDTRSCTGNCGDGNVQSAQGELCDSTDLNGQTCVSLGNYGGTLACNSACTYDESGCQHCGDGVVQTSQGEVCDGAAFAAGYDCTDFGYYAAPGLQCNALCDFDPKNCTGGTCGDFLVNGPETCDDGPPIGETCVTAGYGAGVLECTPGCGTNAKDCRSLSFAPEGRPTGSIITDFGESGGTVFAVAAGAVYKNTGSTWQVAATNGTTAFEDIWALGADDAVVVVKDAASTTAWRYTNSALSPMPGDPAAALEDVWGTAPNNIYAVGAEAGAGVVYRFDGSTWTKVATAGTRLTGIWGVDANTIYAVGNANTAIRYSGGSWSPITVTGATASDDFTSVTGTSATDVIIGSTHGVFSYNGSWTKGTCGPNVVFNVQARAGRGVYAIGQDFSGSSGAGLVCFRAANVWIDVNAGTSAADPPSGLWVASNAEVLLGRKSDILRSGGMTWYATPVATTAARAIWGTSPIDLYVGLDPSGSFNELVRHYNGTSWVDMGLTYTAGQLHQITDVIGIGGQLFVVGNFGRLSRYNGSWSTTFTPSAGVGTFMFSVWGPNTSNVWAVGSSGAIYKWNGSSWASQTSNTSVDLHGVFGFSATDVWAVGSNTILRTTDGTTWVASTIPIPAGGYFQAIWGRSSSDLFVAGSNGNNNPVIYHFNGVSWSPMPIVATTGGLSAFAATPQGDVFAAGSNALFLQLIGARWIPVRALDDFVVDISAGDGFVASTANSAQRLLAGSLTYCSPSEAGSCSDYQDNDCDGFVDCADTDCTGNAWCSAGGSCRPATTITCGQTLAGTTTGGPSKRSAYACGVRQTSGREAYYRLVPGTATSVTVKLTGLTADLDLLVSREQNGACVPETSCVGSSQASSTSNETVTFSALASTPYDLIVDGYQGAAGNFSIQVTCP